MKTSIALRNLLHDKRRALVATSGVAFAILLVFMQLGFYTTCRTSATLVYDSCDFDAILLSTLYVHLGNCSTIPRARIRQALSLPGIASVVPVGAATLRWRNAATGVGRSVAVLGVDPDDSPFCDPDINRSLHMLKKPDTAIMDRIARPIVGPHGVGTVSEINGRRIEVVADYCRGPGMTAHGSLVVSDLTMSRLSGKTSKNRVQLGFVRFDSTADPDAVLRQLRDHLPKDTRVWSRAQLETHEQYYFVHVKPVGFMFTSGIFVGFLVGAVIVYQILSADIANQIPQYATLKALGYRSVHLYRIVVAQGLLFAIVGYCPALALSVGLYALVRNLTDLPMYLTPQHVALVFAASVGMCTLSGLLAVRKVNAADPADLF